MEKITLSNTKERLQICTANSKYISTYIQMKYESTRPDESNLCLLYCHKTAIDQEDKIVGKSCIEKFEHFSHWL